MSSLRIIGTPIVSFEFLGLPSVNSHYGKHWRGKSLATAEWRYEAKEKALKFTSKHTSWEDPFVIKTRALVVVRVFPPKEEISDVHNVYIKGLLDGFTDAGLWRDDEWTDVPLVLYMWDSIGDPETRRTVLDIYEISSLIIRGQNHRLPKGRVRNDNSTKTTPKNNKSTRSKGHSYAKKDKPRSRTTRNERW